MKRAQLTVVSALAWSLSGLGCQPPDSGADAASPGSTSGRSAPDAARARVGKLAFQNRTIDLTLDAFGSGPNAVDPGSYAHIIADIKQAEKEPEPGLDLFSKPPRP
jgi:hypothetical protein